MTIKEISTDQIAEIVYLLRLEPMLSEATSEMRGDEWWTQVLSFLSQADPACISSWDAHIDTAAGGHITGWARKKNIPDPQYLSLYYNGKCVASNLPASLPRADLEDLGIGAHAFICEFVPDFTPYGFFHMEDAGTGKLVAAKIFPASQMFSPEKILSIAGAMLPENRESGAALIRRLWLQNLENPDIIAGTVKLLDKNGDYALLDQLIDLTPHKARLLNTTLIIRMLWAGKGETRALIEKALERASLLPMQVRTPGFINYIGNLIDALCEMDGSPINRLLSRNFAASYVFSRLEKNVNHTDLLASRIAIYAPTPKRLRYFLPVIKHIPYYMADIIIVREEEDDADFFVQNGLEQFTVKKGFSLLSSYSIILAEQHEIDSLRSLPKLGDKKLILLTAGIDASLINQQDVSLFITETEYQTYLESFKFHVQNWTLQQCEKLGAIPYKKKCEYAYTGLYHIGKYLKPEERDKKKLRSELEEILQTKLPTDKPLVAYISDHWVLRGQIAYGLNKLAAHCTIVAKFTHLAPETRAKLDPRILIYEDSSWAPNVLRFAADWIMCGFMGGTALSSLALGLPVITIYSRLLLHLGYDKSKIFPWDSVLESSTNRIPRDFSILRYYRYWDKYFDILDYEAIKKALIEPDYLAWYRDNIGALQKKIFGKYLLEGAPEKTAELIVRFASDGTLGEQCNAVNIHDRFYSE